MNFKHKILLFLILTSQVFGAFIYDDLLFVNDDDFIRLRGNSKTLDFYAHPSASESYELVFPAAKGTVSQALIIDSIIGNTVTLIAGTPGAVTPHDVTGATHTDAATGTVLRGDILTGQTGAPKWTRLGISSSIGTTLTKVVGTDGTDSGFRTLANFVLDFDSLLDHGNLESSSLDDADHNASYYTETELSSDTTGSSGASLIGLASISGSTFSTVQEMQNVFHSSGWVSGGVVTDNGGDTIAVTAGNGTIKATVGGASEILFFDWPANASMSVPANTTRYVGVEYNAGSPQLVVRTSDNFNSDTDFILSSLVNEASTIHLSDEKHAVGDHASKMIRRVFDTSPFARANRDGGLILGESGDNNRNLTMSAGTIWEKLNEFPIAAIDTSGGGGDTFDRYLRDGVSGNHTRQTSQTQWDNTQFDNNGVLTTLGNNKYAVQWYYIELDGEFVSVYGTAQYNAEALAENEAPPTDIPDRINLHAKLIGRIIFQKSDTVPQAVESVFTQTFNAAGVTDHTKLANIGNLTHAEIDTLIDNVTAGTVSASKAVIVDSDKDIKGIRNLDIGSGTPDVLTSDGTTALSTLFGGMDYINVNRTGISSLLIQGNDPIFWLVDTNGSSGERIFNMTVVNGLVNFQMRNDAGGFTGNFIRIVMSSGLVEIINSLNVADDLDVGGNFAINTNKFTVAAATGNTLVAGTLDVTGLASLDGGLDIGVNFSVNAATGNTQMADGTITGTFAHDGTEVGLFNTLPVTQRTHIVDADGTLADITTKFNTLLTYLENGGSGIGVINQP